LTFLQVPAFLDSPEDPCSGKVKIQRSRFKDGTGSDPHPKKAGGNAPGPPILSLFTGESKDHKRLFRPGSLSHKTCDGLTKSHFAILGEAKDLVLSPRYDAELCT
jgi:hypothetical protein